MLRKELREVVYGAVDHRPEVLHSVVLGDLLQGELLKVTSRVRLGRRNVRLEHAWASVVTALCVVLVVGAVAHGEHLGLVAAAEGCGPFLPHTLLDILDVNQVHHLARVVWGHRRSYAVIVRARALHVLVELLLRYVRSKQEAALVRWQARLDDQWSYVVARGRIVLGVGAIAVGEGGGFIAAAQTHWTLCSARGNLVDVKHVDPFGRVGRRHVARHAVVVRALLGRLQLLEHTRPCVVTGGGVVLRVGAVAERKSRGLEAAAQAHDAVLRHALLQVLNVEHIQPLARVVRWHSRRHSVVVRARSGSLLVQLFQGHLRSALLQAALLRGQAGLDDQRRDVVARRRVVLNVRAVAVGVRGRLEAPAQCHLPLLGLSS
mmetsp:Transcript_4790/g.17232  ORF Transcript_4790/g.17232 Transcript_4790/m.17232 type:complete len:376 (+) Transcript_4790:3933-5060(+)